MNWPIGNNFFSLLTGYYPFPNVEHGEVIRVSESNEKDNTRQFVAHPTNSVLFQRKISKGVTAKIDPRFYNRSFAEAKLIDVIKRCHVYDPDERADITEIQKMLEDAIAEDEEIRKRQAESALKSDEHPLEMKNQDEMGEKAHAADESGAIHVEKAHETEREIGDHEEYAVEEDEEWHHGYYSEESESDYEEHYSEEEEWSSGEYYSDSESREYHSDSFSDYE